MKHPLNPTPTAALCLALLASWAVPAAGADAVPWVGETLSGRPCSDFAWHHGYGPYDYTNPLHRAQRLEVVERVHFTERVRRLHGGEHETHPLNDLEYTIGAFPNHHRALYAMVRYATEEAFERQSGMAWASTPRGGRVRPPAECYLQRAAAFAPEDHRVHMLLGLFYHREGLLKAARQAYERALQREPESAETHYNLGLLFVDMKRYEEGRRHARKAYDLGHPLEGLRERLAAAGHPLDG